ncbi:hypothetical protein EFW17_20095 [Halostreptopolyspora alba]|uniref:YitT family protein n=1 Tax=Halostreptopolyspora alba TaxID=2487137 RepID=A0A3N0E324_9ACTN|nr:hypothetical protein EFW17_20095 [Nocardiopsaceae bacterium YIM 96095]
MGTVNEGSPRRPAVALTNLGPFDQLRAGRLARRLPQLFVGLFVYGASLAMMWRGTLGMSPWDVLHTGFIRHVPITLGQAVILFSLLVLVAWIPLRETPGFGTLANALLVGLAIDATLSVLDQPEAVASRVGLMLGGVVLNGVATALYMGAQLGRGPRDGLMTGLHRRTGYSLRTVRTVLELVVLTTGLTLGGAFGVGTLVYALAIGPITQAVLPWFTVDVGTTRVTGESGRRPTDGEDI